MSPEVQREYETRFQFCIREWVKRNGNKTYRNRDIVLWIGSVALAIFGMVTKREYGANKSYDVILTVQKPPRDFTYPQMTSGVFSSVVHHPKTARSQWQCMYVTRVSTREEWEVPIVCVCFATDTFIRWSTASSNCRANSCCWTCRDGKWAEWWWMRYTPCRYESLFEAAPRSWWLKLHKVKKARDEKHSSRVRRTNLLFRYGCVRNSMS